MAKCVLEKSKMMVRLHWTIILLWTINLLLTSATRIHRFFEPCPILGVVQESESCGVTNAGWECRFLFGKPQLGRVVGTATSHLGNGLELWRANSAARRKMLRIKMFKLRSSVPTPVAAKPQPSFICKSAFPTAQWCSLLKRHHRTGGTRCTLF